MKIMHDDKKIRDISTESAETLLASGDVESIKADSIIENMTGYDINLNTQRATLIYGGACKNGNKLTFAFFGTYTHDSNATNFNVLQINIPTEVGAKLYPYSLSAEARMIYSGVVNMFSSRTEYKTIIVDMQKISNGLLNLNFMAVNSAGMTADTTYYFRFEITFLLSDNLAAE